MIKIKAPGRICLFGEHQDYLKYPVIAMAISKYIYLEAERISEPYFFIDMPNINSSLQIQLNNKELEYESKRDYLRSGYNQFIRKGLIFDKGYKIKITGDIPIGAGVSSSSALVMAWLYFLNIITKETLNKFQLAVEGYNSEVREFNEGGGMMDHFTSIFGNVLYIESQNTLSQEIMPSIYPFDVKLDGFVLGNSLETKQTVEDLIRVKATALEAFNLVKANMSSFNPFTTTLEEITPYLPSLSEKHKQKIIGNLLNRDLTIKAKNLILNALPLLKERQNSFEIKKFYQNLGVLLTKHHEQLKSNIKISTNKIEHLITNSKKAGALGAKINGSGFGGTMFALSKGDEDAIVQAIESAGGKAYKIKTSNGIERY